MRTTLVADVGHAILAVWPATCRLLSIEIESLLFRAVFMQATPHAGRRLQWFQNVGGSAGRGTGETQCRLRKVHLSSVEQHIFAGVSSMFV